MYDLFKDPPNEYRIKPFWFLNGDLDDGELKRQLREMRDKGIGGVFICARQGLKIPYLSKKWFEKIKMICAYADSIGLENWLYDEYPYPSGISGGEVTLRHPEAKQKALVDVSEDFIIENDGTEICMELPFAAELYAGAVMLYESGVPDFTRTIDLSDCIGNLQAQELFQKSGLTAYNVKRYFTYEPRKYLMAELPRGRWRVLAVLQKELDDFKYYGTYVDPCNRKAVKTFIQTAHEKYKKYLGEGFKNVKGMFSDEVGLLGSIPWTEQAVGAMKERYGYEPADFIPALYYTTFPDAHRIRFELFDTIHELFRTNYHQQVADWCAENGIALATEVPSMRMSTQMHSHIVGGDTAHEKLGVSFEQIVEKNLYSYRANPQSVSSLTRQLDNRFAMIESFHSIGWSMTMQDAKWQIDRLAGFGINFYNFHAYYYTMESIAKHDAPPSQFIQNAYWKHYKILADYVGRMGVFVTETDTRAKVAVLDPAASLWSLMSNPFRGFTYIGRDKEEELLHDQIRSRWGEIRKELIFAGIDFDNLDADILSMATVEDGKIKVGRAEYSALVLPPLTLIELEATEQLKLFSETGGTLIKTDFEDGNAFLDALKPLTTSAVTVECEAEYRKTLLVTRRYDKDGNLFVFVSNQENNYVDVTFTINEAEPCHFEEFVPVSGDIKKTGVCGNKKTIRFTPFDTKILKLAKGSYEEIEPELPRIVIDISKSMELSVDGENVLPFDTFEFSTDGKSWVNTDVSTLDNQLSSAGVTDGLIIKDKGFGLPKTISFAYPKEVYYRKYFTCDFVPENISVLMDESTIMQDFEMYINGSLITIKDFVHVFVNDIKNIKCPIETYIKQGENEMLVKVTVHNNWGGIRDNVFISGDFSVLRNDGGLHIAEPLSSAALNRRFIEGYPYFCGTFGFKSSFNAKQGRCIITLSEDIYDCVQVLVNGESLGVKAFAPYEWEADVLDGSNIIEIRITNTLIGMLEGGYFDYDLHEFVKI